MGDGNFGIDTSQLEELKSYMESYAGHAGRIIDEVLHGEGAENIKERIASLLPESGRSWRGKAPAASVAMPDKFAQENEPLGVTIAARGTYGYLYFPDDGSNTQKHAGNQHFFERGGTDATKDVINLCIGKLTEDF